MRGKPQAQLEFLTTINLNQRAPAGHARSQDCALGADKAYHQRKFVAGCGERIVWLRTRHAKRGFKFRDWTVARPVAAVNAPVNVFAKGWKKIFGWMKTVGGLRRSRYRGMEQTQAWAYFVAGKLQSAADNHLGLSLQAA